MTNIDLSKVIATITIDGVRYNCHGERTMWNGNLFYMFYKIPGIDTDVVLCPNPESDEPKLYHMTIVPGTTTYNVEEIKEDTPSILRLTAVEDNSYVYINILNSESSTIEEPILPLEISTDDGMSWNIVTFEDWKSEQITLNQDESVLIRCVYPQEAIVDGIAMQTIYFEMEGSISASGDVTSLINGVGGDVTLPKNVFSGMFNGCPLTTAPNLPSTTLSESCYSGMFYGCTSLTTAPELPATTLAPDCYMSMFWGCTSLTTAPELPATTLLGCYCCCEAMFQDCTSLTTAPELPATTLDYGCYSGMFQGCTSLTTAPDLPAITLVSNCYKEMFYGCTSLTTAPELPATNLAVECYSGMFGGCTNLQSVKCLATDISAENCTNGWLSNVSETGTFTKSAAMDSWTTGDDGIPSGWTVEVE